MAQRILIDRQDIVNLYRVQKNLAVQLERILVQFDLTDDSEERKAAVARIEVPKS